jgi:SH3-like domain-containing protein
MRSPALILLASMWLLAIGGNVAIAQSSPTTVTPTPAGASQAPQSGKREQPVNAPAPKEPVRKPGIARPAKTPVVPPHGPIHPQKPVATTARASGNQGAPNKAGALNKAAPPQPPAEPVPPPAETKAAQPEKLPDPEKPEGAPARLPRFASLRSDDVNMRAGPGTRYRIDWVYKRRDLPVKIQREFENWRWVSDADGISGWVHQATLMGRRDFIVQKADATLRSEASDAAASVAVLKPGVIGRIRSCDAASDWCNVQTGSYRGYLRREQFWGTFPDEPITP